MSGLLSGSSGGYRSPSVERNIHPILGAIRSLPLASAGPAEPRADVVPFVTVSREPGAGATSLGDALCAELNTGQPEERRWTRWDRELVQKVAEDHHLRTELVESLEESSYSWLMDLFNSLPFSGTTDEVTVYRRVAQTVRALARVGRVILVGRGAVFITQNLPGGIHLRLIAPRPVRVANMARRLNVSQREAAATVREREQQRGAFLKRFWPDKPLRPATFTITFNTAQTSETEMVSMLTSLIRLRTAQQLGVGAAVVAAR